jgi:formate hydrogenlyase transcriptional activator
MAENVTARLASGPSPEQFRALLEVAESIAQHRDLSELFQDLAHRLQAVVPFDFINLILHDPQRNVMRLHVLKTVQPRPALPFRELPLEESPSGWVWQTQQPLVVSSLEQETRFPQVISFLREEGIRSACLLPLTTAQRRLGVMGFGSSREYTLAAGELEFLQQVARQVAVAVDNALNYQEAQSYQQQLARERDRLRVLLDVNNALVSHLDFRELFGAISSSLRRVMHCDYVSLALHDAETNRMRVRALDFPAGKGLLHEEMLLPIDATPAGRAFTTRQPLLLNRRELQESYPELARLALAEGLRSGCCLPLLTRNRALGTLNVASLGEGAFSQEDLDFLNRVAVQIAIAVENALAYTSIEEQKKKLAEEKLYLEDEIRTEYSFEEMIGQSRAWKHALEQVKTVAPTDSTVLLFGETGTGKELLARAIHNLSARRERTFVKLNCAAIPMGLLESELFGHEKGAFTGAITQRNGRFELAHRGTLFLDEVGDIPLELQPKLLRVLQEQEFERLGSTRTQRVDVRLVAATNRDLARMVADREFRNDLYYRLNIFPIVVPPLRERPEDIPVLVRYFAQKYSSRLNKRIETIPAETMEALVHYSWPGNVRELENLIERAVILSPDSTLRIPLHELRSPAEVPASGLTTLEQAERAHIHRALEATGWVIGGPKGAASLLGMKRTTLQSKMQKLRILRPE